MTKNKTVKLSSKIKIDGKETDEITLRCPKTGELRGLSLTNIMQSDASAWLKLLPRIAPATEAQIADLPPSDFLTLVGEGVGFFISEEQMSQIKASL
ncbi:MAG: phage tail protein [Rhodobacterales bacterium]|nr:MAG: phage tail protein [Rhodobacterales bacterium]